jgi:ABC-2 type transport system ATP-binding protein
MIHNPRLLLLDEPTTGLDAAARESIWLRLLAFAAQGTAIVFSTHDLGETQYCSQVVTLSTDWMPAGQAPTCAAHL